MNMNVHVLVLNTFFQLFAMYIPSSRVAWLSNISLKKEMLNINSDTYNWPIPLI